MTAINLRSTGNSPKSIARDLSNEWLRNSSIYELVTSPSRVEYDTRTISSSNIPAVGPIKDLIFKIGDSGSHLSFNLGGNNTIMIHFSNFINYFSTKSGLKVNTQVTSSYSDYSLMYNLTRSYGVACNKIPHPKLEISPQYASVLFVLAVFYDYPECPFGTVAASEELLFNFLTLLSYSPSAQYFYRLHIHQAVDTVMANHPFNFSKVLVPYWSESPFIEDKHRNFLQRHYKNSSVSDRKKSKSSIPLKGDIRYAYPLVFLTLISMITHADAADPIKPEGNFSPLFCMFLLIGAFIFQHWKDLIRVIRKSRKSDVKPYEVIFEEIKLNGAKLFAECDTVPEMRPESSIMLSSQALDHEVEFSNMVSKFKDDVSDLTLLPESNSVTSSLDDGIDIVSLLSNYITNLPSTNHYRIILQSCLALASTILFTQVAGRGLLGKTLQSLLGVKYLPPEDSLKAESFLSGSNLEDTIEMASEWVASKRENISVLSQLIDTINNCLLLPAKLSGLCTSGQYFSFLTELNKEFLSSGSFFEGLVSSIMHTIKRLCLLQSGESWVAVHDESFVELTRLNGKVTNGTYTDELPLIPLAAIEARTQKYLQQVEEKLLLSKTGRMGIPDYVSPYSVDKTMSMTRTDLEIKQSKCKQWLEDIRLKHQEGAMRMQPFAYVLYGQAGCGKSTGSDAMMDILHVANGYGDIHVKAQQAEGDAYQTTLMSDTTDLRFDDIGALLPAFRKVAITLGLLHGINNTRAPAVKPDLPSKGKVFNNTLFVGVTTNRQDLGVLVEASHPEAVYRRFPLMVHMQVDKDVQDEHGCIDTHKVEQLTELGKYSPMSVSLLPDFCTYRCYKMVRPDPTSLPAAVYVTGPLRSGEFVNNILIPTSKRHFSEQARLLKNMLKRDVILCNHGSLAYCCLSCAQNNENNADESEYYSNQLEEESFSNYADPLSGDPTQMSAEVDVRDVATTVYTSTVRDVSRLHHWCQSTFPNIMENNFLHTVSEEGSYYSGCLTMCLIYFDVYLSLLCKNSDGVHTIIFQLARFLPLIFLAVQFMTEQRFTDNVLALARGNSTFQQDEVERYLREQPPLFTLENFKSYSNFKEALKYRAEYSKERQDIFNYLDSQNHTPNTYWWGIIKRDMSIFSLPYLLVTTRMTLSPQSREWFNLMMPSALLWYSLVLYTKISEHTNVVLWSLLLVLPFPLVIVMKRDPNGFLETVLFSSYGLSLLLSAQGNYFTMVAALLIITSLCILSISCLVYRSVKTYYYIMSFVNPNEYRHSMLKKSFGVVGATLLGYQTIKLFSRCASKIMKPESLLVDSHVVDNSNSQTIKSVSVNESNVLKPKEYQSPLGKVIHFSPQSIMTAKDQIQQVNDERPWIRPSRFIPTPKSNLDRDALTNLTLQSMVTITLEKNGKQYEAYGVFVDSTMIVTTGHTFSAFENDDVIHGKIKKEFPKVEYNFSVRSNELFHDYNRDLVYIWHNAKGSSPNINKVLTSDYLKGNLGSILLSPEFKGLEIKPTSIIVEDTPCSYTLNGHNFSPSHSASYSINRVSFSGMCGAPIISYDSGGFIGLHCAGTQRQRSNCGVIQITTQDVDKAHAEIKRKCSIYTRGINLDRIKTSVGPHELQTTSTIHQNNCLNYCPNPVVLMETVNTPFNTKSDIVSNPDLDLVVESFPECNTDVHVPKKALHALREACVLGTNLNVDCQLDSTSLKRSIDSYVSGMINRNIDPLVVEEWMKEPITLYQVYNGVDGCPYRNGMRMSKSAGLPFSGKKSKLFTQPLEDGPYSPEQYLTDSINEAEDSIRQRDHSGFIYNALAKDEARALSKDKPRIFYCGNTVGLAILMKWVSPITGFMIANNKASEIMMGVDPTGPSWEESMGPLVNQTMGIDADFKSFDLTFGKKMQSACVHAFTEIARVHLEWTQDNLDMLEKVLEESMETLVNFRGAIVQTTNMCTSGTFITGLLQCLRGILTLRDAIYNLYEEAGLPLKNDEWDKYFLLRIMGDDNLLVIKDGHSVHFTPLDLANKLEEYGVYMTPEQKGETFDNWKLVSECVMLQRTNVRHPDTGKLYGRLRAKSVWSPFVMNTRKNYKDSMFHYAIANVALAETYCEGEEKYNETRNKVIDHFKRKHERDFAFPLDFDYLDTYHKYHLKRNPLLIAESDVIEPIEITESVGELPVPSPITPMSVNELLATKFPIRSFNMTPGTVTPLTIITPLQAIVQNPYYKNKMSNLAYCNFGVKLTIEVIATCHHSGMAIMSCFMPNMAADAYSGSAGQQNPVLGASREMMRPHVMIDMSKGGAYSVTAPFFYMYDRMAVPVAAGDRFYNPTFIFRPLVYAQHALGAETPIRLRVYAELTDIEVSGRTGLVAESLESEGNSTIKGNIMSAAGDVFRALAPLVIPEEIALLVANPLLRAIGLSRPIEHSVNTAISAASCSLYNSNADIHGKSLTLDKFHSIGFKNSMSFNPNEDEMGFGFFANKHILIGATNWKENYATDRNLLLINVGPCLTPIRTAEGAEYVSVTGPGAICMFNQRWAGTMHYNFKIIGPSSMSGSIIICYEPLLFGLPDITTNQSIIVDISKTREVDMTVHWNSPKLSLLTQTGTLTDPILGPYSPDLHNGRIIVRVVDSCMTTNALVEGQLTILTTACFDKNMIFYEGIVPNLETMSAPQSAIVTEGEAVVSRPHEQPGRTYNGDGRPPKTREDSVEGWPDPPRYVTSPEYYNEELEIIDQPITYSNGGLALTYSSAPTNTPNMAPTNAPTKKPTKAPTKKPTRNPTKTPTKNPTMKPTKTPTPAPTMANVTTLTPTDTCNTCQTAWGYKKIPALMCQSAGLGESIVYADSIPGIIGTSLSIRWFSHATKILAGNTISIIIPNPRDCDVPSMFTYKLYASEALELSERDDPSSLIRTNVTDAETAFDPGIFCTQWKMTSWRDKFVLVGTALNDTWIFGGSWPLNTDLRVNIAVPAGVPVTTQWGTLSLKSLGAPTHTVTNDGFTNQAVLINSLTTLNLDTGSDTVAVKACLRDMPYYLSGEGVWTPEPGVTLNALTHTVRKYSPSSLPMDRLTSSTQIFVTGIAWFSKPGGRRLVAESLETEVPDEKISVIFGDRGRPADEVLRCCAGENIYSFRPHIKSFIPLGNTDLTAGEQIVADIVVPGTINLNPLTALMSMFAGKSGSYVYAYHFAGTGSAALSRTGLFYESPDLRRSEIVDTLINPVIIIRYPVFSDSKFDLVVGNMFTKPSYRIINSRTFEGTVHESVAIGEDFSLIGFNGGMLLRMA